MPLSHQNVLVDQLRVIFPNETPIINSRKQSQLKYSPDADNNLELDIWFPTLNICFEFQDDYHYVTTWYNHKSIHQVHQSDKKKKEVIAQKEIRLIEISCWWDSSIESLGSTIHFNCPDISVPIPYSPPIPLNPRLGFFPLREIPNVGELTYPSFLMDPLIVSGNNWWLGEKYDGVRCCSNPTKRKVYSRHGNELLIHSSLLPHVPSVCIDGELWFGRNNFALTYQLVNKLENLTSWDSLRWLGFETVAIELQPKPFEERYLHFLQNTPNHSPFIIPASRLGMPQNDQLNYFAQLIIDSGGEGIILQKFRASYERGRSQSILKFKMMLDDREGMVIGKDRKAVHLKLPNEMTFAVPLENVYLSNLSVGDIVTFSCDNYTNRHAPVNPVIHRWRTDVSWRDVMRLYLQEQKYLSSTPFFSKTTVFSVNEMRQFLEDFARKKFLDPFSPETWYSIKDSDLYQFKKGRKILKLFKGYAPALRQLFPDISFDMNLLAESMQKDSGSKRKVFENFAKENHFDPLNPENWYAQRKNRLLSSTDVYRVIEGSYNNNVSRALMDLFPEIGLEKFEFTQHWANPKKRRKFFEKYARRNGFDPLNAENWYLQSKKKILSIHEARYVIGYHGNSITKSLLDLFPEIGLDQAKLVQSPWRNTPKQRNFFEEYARENGFDPLFAENWYSHAESIRKLKIAKRIAFYHNGKLSDTLIALFPEVEFTKSKFRTHLFQAGENRRNFFVKFALDNNFDPLVPENWYNLSQQKIMSVKGAYTVMDYHGNSTSRALLELFPEIGLDASKFWKSPLSDEKNRRAFFESYANARNFDPLVPGNWYSQLPSQLMQIKGIHRVLKYHKGSITRALAELFPEIGLQRAKL